MEGSLPLRAVSQASVKANPQSFSCGFGVLAPSDITILWIEHDRAPRNWPPANAAVVVRQH